jgi:hypothetical protein
MVKFKSLLLSSGVLVLAALPFSPAMAAAPMGFAGNASASYGSSSCDGCDSVDSWNVEGSGAFGFNSSFAGQIDGSFNSTSFDDLDVDVNVWGIGGSLYWAPLWGRLGGSLHYQAADVSDFDLDIEVAQFGAFIEYFAGNYITLGAKAGGIGYSFDDDDSESGGYVGGELTGYALPNLAIRGNIDYITLSDDVDVDVTNYGIGAEFLISEMVPISIFGGYTHSETEFFGSEGDADTWMVGLRIYTNGNGNTLIERHRNGAVGSISGLGTSSLFNF